MRDWCNFRGGEREPLCDQERWQIWLRQTSLDIVFDFTEEEMFKTNFSGVFIIHAWRQVECPERVTDWSGHWPVKCPQCQQSFYITTQTLTRDSWLIRIGFGFTTFDNHVLLTSNFSKKSLQPSSMSVTLTVTLTPRMEFTFKRKKMHGANIIYGWIFITCFPDFCFSRESDQFSPDDWEVQTAAVTYSRIITSKKVKLNDFKSCSGFSALCSL